MAHQGAGISEPVTQVIQLTLTKIFTKTLTKELTGITDWTKARSSLRLS
ncbi:MAG: hypothetical protein ACK5QS_05535 [Pseudanabaenaceae cyanobacterium]